MISIFGTYLIVARKGGRIEKVSLAANLRERAVTFDPLVHACRILRDLLRRCGYAACDCKGDTTRTPSDNDPDKEIIFSGSKIMAKTLYHDFSAVSVDQSRMHCDWLDILHAQGSM